jgi:DNA end-binding protein Ku
MQKAVFKRKKVGMAARAIWKGVLKIAGNKVPVKLYSAVQDRTVHFHILDKSGKQPVKQRMVDPENDEEVPKEQIQRGLEVKPGTFVLIDEDEVAKFEPKASRHIEITRFVPPARVNHQWYERPYYVGPDGDTAVYFALAKALESSEREGVARWVMRNKQYVGALNAKDGYLFLVTLRHADEVISAKQLPKPGGRKLDDREIRMAEQLVTALEDEFRPGEYQDQYRERVMQFIEAKAKGRAPKLQVIREKRAPSSLADALAASLKQAKRAGGKAVA